jgi:hypothetical protein
VVAKIRAKMKDSEAAIADIEKQIRGDKRVETPDI